MLATFTTGETDTVHNIRVASLGNNETGFVRIALVDIDRYMWIHNPRLRKIWVQIARLTNWY